MKKRIIILDGIFIYSIALILLALVFHKNPAVAWLWANVFNENIYRPLGVMLLFEMIMAIVTIRGTLRCIRSYPQYGKEKALSFAKIQMFMRVAQIPAYVIIFIAGVVGMVTIFTIVISVMLAIFDLMSITVTGICSVGVYTVLAKEGLITNKERIRYSVGSFIYCLDVIVAISCYDKLEERSQKDDYNWDNLINN